MEKIPKKKIVIVDTLSSNNKIPNKFKKYIKVWDFREALLYIWTNELSHIAIPNEIIPGYDFIEFIDKMVGIKQIDKPIVYQYSME